jgi:AraC-like DNA-binding protein
VPIEVSAGEYYIQQQNSYQIGERVSDSPQYLYVHFSSVWCEGNDVLCRRGTFDYTQLKPLMERLDHYAHNRATLLERTAVFSEILALLYRKQQPRTPVRGMAEFLAEHIGDPLSLDRLSEEFNFSKNHVIHMFKRELGVTPIEYINALRIQKAMQWLESTSETAEVIAVRCGFHYYSHFYRLFLRATGVSPTKWRRRQQVNPS